MRIADGIGLNGNVTYLDTAYGDEVASVSNGEPPLGGQRLVGAPQWSGAISANIDRPISNIVGVLVRPEVYLRT